MKRIFDLRVWKYLIAFAVPVFVAIMFTGGLDNDSWFVLAEGRQIVENGIYYTDELSMHTDYEVTVHNYGFSVICWLIYSVAGAPGLYAMMLAMLGLLLWLIYKVCMLLSGKNEALSLALMSATGAAMAAGGFIVTRGQMVSYITIIGVIYALELYIKKGSPKYLWWLPVLSLIAINIRAAAWPMLFLVVAAYLVDGIKLPKLHLQGYKKKPILLVTLVALLVGFLNPYGWKMMTFVLTSYGVPEISGFVNEMSSFDPFGGVSLFVIYAAIVAVICLYIFGEKKNVRVRYLLLFFGFLTLGLSSMKSMGELMLVALFPLALVHEDWRPPRLIESKKVGRIAIGWVGVVATCMTIGAVMAVMTQIKNYPSESLSAAMDAIDAEVSEGVDKESLKIYVNYDNGGYVEFRGYPAFLDPRAEVFIKANNGKEDLLDDWLQFDMFRKTSQQEFLDKWDFDFLLVRRDEAIYELDDEKYELIYANDIDDEEGDRVYKKVE